MELVNRFGLKRRIPDPIKRTVRQKYGFGCIICGSAIIEYDHHDPVYAEAKEHSPDGIIILCPQCHSKVTRGFWSRKKVVEAVQNPKCLEEGYTKELFDIGYSHPKIKIGGFTLSNCMIPLQIHGSDLIRVQKPEKNGAPFRLSANLYNQNGKRTLIIDENEWIADTNNWDIETIGPRITIRESHRNVNLVIRALPPDGIAIERIQMLVGNYFIDGDENDLTIHEPSGNTFKVRGFGDNCLVGFVLG